MKFPTDVEIQIQYFTVNFANSSMSARVNWRVIPAGNNGEGFVPPLTQADINTQAHQVPQFILDEFKATMEKYLATRMAAQALSAG